MSQQFLLDTNAISAILKNPNGAVANAARSVANETIFTSVIVACELMFGAQKSQSVKLKQRIESLLETLTVKPLPQGFEKTYGQIRAAMERKGFGISAMDLLIACHALVLGATLVTDNMREFSRVPGLQVVSWS
jgi:tRNA(fMet)-specific endonuclease VapC